MSKELAEKYSCLTPYLIEGIDHGVVAEDIKKISKAYLACGDKYLSLQQEHASTKEQLSLCNGELENERMRLAACSTAALGYFDGCIDAYKSASLDDVLSLYSKYEAAQKDNAVLRESLKRIEIMSIRPRCVCGVLTGTAAIKSCAKKALSQTPTDIICITREELMEPSSGMVDETLLFYEDNEHYWAGYDAEYIKASWKVLITQLLKEREDK